LEQHKDLALEKVEVVVRVDYRDLEEEHRGLIDRDLIDRDLIDRDLIDRDLIDRDLIDRDLIDRDLVDRRSRGLELGTPTSYCWIRPVPHHVPNPPQ
jgi:hypothetical protein